MLYLVIYIYHAPFQVPTARAADRFISIYVCMCMYVRMYVCICVCIHTYVCMYVCMYIRMYVYRGLEAGIAVTQENEQLQLMLGT